MQSEVERIRQMYAERDRNPIIQERWAPFAEDEVDHRNQQYWSMAEMFREIGRSSLAGLKILDVGCGQGRLLRACLDMGASAPDLAGVDLRVNAIEEANRLSPQLQFQLGSGTELNFPDSEFDVVTQFVVFSSIFHSDLRQQLAKEMFRVLKPGGYIFWWDLMRTVSRGSPEPLHPRDLFFGVDFHESHHALRPKLSRCLRLPYRLQSMGRLIDRFGYSPTHVAALIGPKQ
jgi:ubiquinone/menaquinone biosynthesis C-methylase UbiE